MSTRALSRPTTAFVQPRFFDQLKADPRNIIEKASAVFLNPEKPISFFQCAATDTDEAYDFIRNLIKNPVPAGAEIAYTLLTAQNNFGSNALYVFANTLPKETMEIIQKAPEAVKVKMLSCPHVAGELCEAGYGKEIMDMIKALSKADQSRIIHSPNVAWGIDNAARNDAELKTRFDTVKQAINDSSEYAPGF